MTPLKYASVSMDYAVITTANEYPGFLYQLQGKYPRFL
jgi:hypothetical protein